MDSLTGKAPVRAASSCGRFFTRKPCHGWVLFGPGEFETKDSGFCRLTIRRAAAGIFFGRRQGKHGPARSERQLVTLATSCEVVAGGLEDHGHLAEQLAGVAGNFSACSDQKAAERDHREQGTKESAVHANGLVRSLEADGGSWDQNAKLRHSMRFRPVGRAMARKMRKNFYLCIECRLQGRGAPFSQNITGPGSACHTSDFMFDAGVYLH